MTIQCTTCRYLDVEPNEIPCNHCGNFNMWEIEEYRTVEELNKIKEEILKHHSIKCYDTCETYCPYSDCIESKDVIEDLQIIDKHIAELKGENKCHI